MSEILTPAEVKRFTGHDTWRTQANFLKKHRIKHLVNAKKEVILTWGWINGGSDPVNTEEEQPDFQRLRRAQA